MSKAMKEKIIVVIVILTIVATIASVYDTINYGTNKMNEEIYPIELTVTIILWLIIIVLIVKTKIEEKSLSSGKKDNIYVSGRYSSYIDSLLKYDSYFKNGNIHYYKEIGDMRNCNSISTVDKNGNTRIKYTITIQDNLIDSIQKQKEALYSDGIIMGRPVIGLPAEYHSYSDLRDDLGQRQVVTKIHEMPGNTYSFEVDGNKPHQHLVPKIYVEVSYRMNQRY